LLTNDVGDTVTGTAEFKVCAAQVTRIESVAQTDRFPGSFYGVHGPS
jgi:hypothetical protein